MAFAITDDCIVCGRCEKACPTESIFLGDDIYEIKPDTCNDCRGVTGGAQCAAVCPVECCIPIRSKYNNRSDKKL